MMLSAGHTIAVAAVLFGDGLTQHQKKPRHSRSRKKYISRHRRTGWYFARYRHLAGYSTLSRFCGWDHTSILHGIRLFDGWRQDGRLQVFDRLPALFDLFDLLTLTHGERLMERALNCEQYPEKEWRGDAVTRHDGTDYMRDARGAMVPLTAVKPTDQLEDQLVRRMMKFAVELSEQITRFKGHCNDDIAAFQALLQDKYAAPKKGGKKGNVTFQSFDGCMKMQVQIADQITFGPELQVAKQLVDSCISRWSEGSQDELKAIVNRAFQVDKEGRINRSDLLMLLRVDIKDDEWLRGMEAIRDSIRVIGTKSYLRFYTRKNPEDAWQAVTIDLAKAAD